MADDVTPPLTTAPAAPEVAAKTVRPLPRCLQIRTKMDFVVIAQGSRPSGRPAEWDEDETLGGTAHRYYCRRTMTVIGPDGDLVGPHPCAPGRDCFESCGF